MSELNNKKILPAEKKSPQVPEPKEPVRMPMLVLRGLVLFPQMVLHFDVGREKSILALNRVMSGDRKINLHSKYPTVSVDWERGAEGGRAL